jgi:hypothetical protein
VRTALVRAKEPARSTNSALRRPSISCESSLGLLSTLKPAMEVSLLHHPTVISPQVNEGVPEIHSWLSSPICDVLYDLRS